MKNELNALIMEAMKNDVFLLKIHKKLDCNDFLLQSFFFVIGDL